jgi:hypothetical protein
MLIRGIIAAHFRQSHRTHNCIPVAKRVASTGCTYSGLNGTINKTSREVGSARLVPCVHLLESGASGSSSIDNIHNIPVNTTVCETAEACRAVGKLWS